MQVVCRIIRDDGRQTRALCNTDEAQKGSMVQALARSLFLLSSYIKKTLPRRLTSGSVSFCGLPRAVFLFAAYHGQCFFLQMRYKNGVINYNVTKTASSAGTVSACFL